MRGAGENFTFLLHTSVLEGFYNELKNSFQNNGSENVHMLFNAVIPLLNLLTEKIIREAVKGFVSMYRIIVYRSIVCNSKKFQVVSCVEMVPFSNIHFM